ncbi:MAG: metal-dependent hydrolase [Salinisphaera sp.]|nr:metal-dependent hydrolase [Salinisphaera sp.]
MASVSTQAAVPASEPIPVPRKIPFEFPDDMEPLWIPGDPEFAAMVNGASLVMPYLEPFLVRTMREAVEQVQDPALRETGRAFNAQEQHHFQAHRRFNELLKNKRYAELADIEDAMKAAYARLNKRSLRRRMAYTAGFETMTLGVTKFLVEKRVRLFAGADTRVASFILWHMVEETEHKRVAYDVYQAVCGHGLAGYTARAFGVFHGALDVIRFSMRGYKVILKKEGLWYQPRSRLRLARRLGSFIRHVGPFLLRGALPGHDPRREKDPQWVQDWIAGHRQAEPDVLPLIDTNNPKMPVPFAIHLQGRASAC